MAKDADVGRAQRRGEHRETVLLRQFAARLCPFIWREDRGLRQLSRQSGAVRGEPDCPVWEWVALA
ncbi:hypothetical protein GALL_551210 [mine drainage metagenome]|uniref:Uncharacterized protein n=1 Tax=mine drainage metagenome TaxID=410659 RepID=A0A1J5NX39_9ZZZZ